MGHLDQLNNIMNISIKRIAINLAKLILLIDKIMWTINTKSHEKSRELHKVKIRYNNV